MRAFVAGRAGGKTYQGIEYLKSVGGGVMFVRDKRMAEILKSQHGPKERCGIEFIAFAANDHRFYERIRGLGYQPSRVVVDDLDDVLQRILGVTVDMVTFNGPNDQSTPPIPAHITRDNPFLIDGDW